MPLYQLRLKLDRDAKKQLLAALRLRFIKEIAITDRYLPPRPAQPKEKIQLLDGKMRFCQLASEDHCLVIKGRDILDLEEQKAFQHTPVVTQLERRKEIYAWPGHHAEAAFVHFFDIPDIAFFEASDRNHELIHQAQQELTQMGYSEFVTDMYDEIIPTLRRS